MPRRNDLHSILVIGSGPIVIGQGCEFDYSGTQACKVLKEEGFRVILVNSNPATIMTDPAVVDATYIEPLTPRFLEPIIAREKPDAILPTVGGQVALNAALSLSKEGILEKYNVNLIGASLEAIEKAEDRDLFKKAMERVEKTTGLATKMARSGLAHNLEEARRVLADIGLPMIIRPAFTLGGSGGGTVYKEDDFERMVQAGLDASPISQVLLEESVIGWKEYELEVMRDNRDNVVIICSIENIDPMGVHTGDSITVAPQQTLTDREYQNLRDMSLAIIREIGVDTGGCNIQFAVNPADGTVYVIEMNPRVSRSSALASKATGFPIAKMAAKLAVGYSLDEIQNDITRETPASFEPSIDYVVTKIPRWDFAKFEGVDRHLGTAMKSVGEAMAIGRTLKESLQKGLRSLENDRYGFGNDGDFNELILIHKLGGVGSPQARELIEDKLRKPSDDRIFYMKLAFEAGIDLETIRQWTGMDPYFLTQFEDLHQAGEWFTAAGENGFANDANFPDEATALRYMKRLGFSNRQLSYLTHREEIRLILAGGELTESERKSKINQILRSGERVVEGKLRQHNITPVYKQVDTCAGEFAAQTPYLYSCHDNGDEAPPTDREKIIILGGGTNRIGQGIEFDYCCCHASYAIQENDLEAILVNSNPETVSTDYDTSDRLYFEPMTFQDVLAIVRRENPRGVIVQFGGQTPLKLARQLETAGVPILGTSVDAIDRAEDRERFHALIQKLNLRQPEGTIVHSRDDSIDAARDLGFPVLVRPSYVLGGRAMAIVRDENSLREYLNQAEAISQEQPILIDKYLEGAVEVDVDALSDGRDVVIGGVLEHIEAAGVHSGDSACALPPHNLAPEIIEEIEETTRKLGQELQVIGLLNVQYAVSGGEVFVIEVNPRASRTVPFISKATGVPLAKLATEVMLGKTIAELAPRLKKKGAGLHFVKEAVLPFKKLPGVDTILGPEMKSTGEVMGMGQTPLEAFFKSQEAAGMPLPLSGGRVFFSVDDEAKEELLTSARELATAGYKLVATRGTAEFLKDRAQIAVEIIDKVHEGPSNIVRAMQDGGIDLIINRPGNMAETRKDAFAIRQAAIVYTIPYFTTVEAAKMAMEAMAAASRGEFMRVPLQEFT